MPTAKMSGGANHSRPTSITYPNGRVVNFTYASGLDDSISRLTSLTDSGVTEVKNELRVRGG